MADDGDHPQENPDPSSSSSISAAFAANANGGGGGPTTATVVDNSNGVAEGLYAVVSSVMNTFESTAEATSRSQDQLSSSLDRLTSELDKLLEDAPSPFIMQHSARISSVRKRVKALNSVLKSIQRRIDNMDRMLSAGSVREGPASDKGGQQ